ncbi:MAG TPA: ABC transporter substrate-binding protein [Devosia sp.]|nr:ABC transporter substrate-binding protein [Devosia sp.]
MKLCKLILAGALLMTASATASAQTVNLRTTIPANSMFFMPLFVADSLGYFADNGIAMETVITNGDGPDVDALISGSVDFTISTPNRLLTAYQQGKPLLAVMSVMDRMGIQCFMNKDVAGQVKLDDAKTPEEKFATLKGQTIAGTRPGAFTYLLAVDYLKRAGLVPQQDAQIIGIGAGPAMIAAVENGQAAMGCFGSPIVESAVARGKAVWFIKNTAGEDSKYNDFLFQMVYVRPEYAQENPEVVRSYVAALLKANQWIAQASTQDLLVEVKKRFEAVPDDTLTEAIENMRGAYSQTGMISQQSFDAAAQFLRDTDMLEGEVPWDAVSDNQYLPAN